MRIILTVKHSVGFFVDIPEKNIESAKITDIVYGFEEAEDEETKNLCKTLHLFQDITNSAGGYNEAGLQRITSDASSIRSVLSMMKKVAGEHKTGLEIVRE